MSAPEDFPATARADVAEAVDLLRRFADIGARPEVSGLLAPGTSARAARLADRLAPHAVRYPCETRGCPAGRDDEWGAHVYDRSPAGIRCPRAIPF